VLNEVLDIVVDKAIESIRLRVSLLLRRPDFLYGHLGRDLRFEAVEVIDAKDCEAPSEAFVAMLVERRSISA